MSLHELDLAQKISDHIICVKGDNSIGRFGTPEEIFSGDYIKELFQIEKGTYLTDYGSVELEAVKESRRCLSLAEMEQGSRWYRQLQKRNSLCSRYPVGKRQGISGGRGTGFCGDSGKSL